MDSSTTYSVILAVVAALLAIGMTFQALRASKLARMLSASETSAATLRGEVEKLRTSAQALVRQIDELHRDIEARKANMGALAQQIEEISSDEEKKAGWLDHQEKEIAWLRAELERRPKITRKTYKVLTLGMKWTGKTSLTLKWANPLIDLGQLQGTKIERYERTVSQVEQKDVRIEHVFEIRDWGGEHIVDAQQELIMDEIHGLLIVVDLGDGDAKNIDPQRIQEQLREFQPQALRYFFGPRTVACCKAVVLFINKSDLLPGTPAEVEEKAKKLYETLIDDLMKYSNNIDVRVFVGSASYGHSTHLLFSHFVEKILPKDAYDGQLLQRLKSDVTPPPPTNFARPLPPAQTKIHVNGEGKL
jgi:hypothetical protein